jgi:2-C-methyl-D-erythritol 4-phosphate cytidylyltransferase
VEGWAIVVAAGSGERFGRPKQFEALGGRRVLDMAVSAASASCAGVVVVVPPGCDSAPVAGADVIVAGGETRSASVRAGLAAVPASADIIVVHDAARPLARAELWAEVMGAVERGAEAAIPAVPVTDTLKRIVDGRVAETIDRGQLVAVQTPQAFRAELLRRAHAGGGDATDDAALVEALGAVVTVVTGDPDNLKITSPVDLVVAEALLAERGGR